jgi:hypothetical protein
MQGAVGGIGSLAAQLKKTGGVPKEGDADSDSNEPKGRMRRWRLVCWFVGLFVCLFISLETGIVCFVFVCLSVGLFFVCNLFCFFIMHFLLASCL